MAETDEGAGVDYYAVLNVRKEVKIVFQRERLRGIFFINHVKCISLHFRQTKMSSERLPDACALLPGQASRSRENESKV